MAKIGYLILPILFLVYALPQASASDLEIYNIFVSMLSSKYIDSISDLPHSDGVPEKNVQSSGHIKAWIDIVGFRDMVRDNGTDYVPGNPADYAIIQNDAWGVFQCSICGYDIIKNVQKQTSGSYTRVTMDLKMTWYEKICGENGCFCIEHIEYASFSDLEKSPEIYPRLKDGPVFITIYNTTFEPKTGVRFRVENATKTRISYQNSSLAYYEQIAHVEYTNKNVPFGNMTLIESWERKGEEISHIGDEIIINGTVEPQEVIVQAFTPYETMTLTNYTVHIHNPSPPFNSVFLPFLLVMIVLYVGTSKILREL